MILKHVPNYRRQESPEGEKERFIEDYTKVAMARYKAPPEEKREAMEKALRAVWAERRRGKAIKTKEGKSKK